MDGRTNGQSSATVHGWAFSSSFSVLLRLFLLPDFAGIFFLITLNEPFFFIVFLCQPTRFLPFLFRLGFVLSPSAEPLGRYLLTECGAADAEGT
jgi:hypothetical protein